MPAPSPELSAIIVVGTQRARAQRVLDALYEQTAADTLEVVVADTSAAQHLPLATQPEVASTQYLEYPSDLPWGHVRAAAVHAASAPVVAFIEDHSLPAPTWAAAVAAAHQEDWAAVGYAFANANPDSYRSWVGFIADYGLWAHPLPPGPHRLLPCNNMSYKRDALLALEDDLGELFHSDTNVQEELRRRGERMTVAAGAVVAHQNHEEIGQLLHANFVHCRIIGASRVRQGRWSWARRLGYGLSVPVVVPFLKLARLLRVQARRRALWGRTLATLPLVMGVFVWSSVGEGMGYLLGPGEAVAAFKDIEITLPRSTQMTIS